MEIVIIIGASDKPERYSYQAKNLLSEYGHKTLLVHPRLQQIEGQEVYHGLSEIKETPDTISMYVNPKLSSPLLSDILRLAPKRVIFNPGTENQDLCTELNKHGIKTEEACTLVLLRTGQF
ncbi:MAG: CoA-binding protein [Halobacteriovoraceae bacterium]|jgi:uncharacterized protein|nr:CoA-binding protein [Halobacteriovoraceae bacterium]